MHNMKKFLFIVLLFTNIYCYAAEMTLPIRGVADGDTIKTMLNLPCPLCYVSIRILGIDTPESTYLAKCPAELAKGLEAKLFLTNLVKGHDTMTVRDVKWDKYGGRIDATVEIDNKNVADLLIAAGLAKPYTGQGPKPNWCS